MTNISDVGWCIRLRFNPFSSDSQRKNIKNIKNHEKNYLKKNRDPNLVQIITNN
jgi:hypothetical protein